MKRPVAAIGLVAAGLIGGAAAGAAFGIPGVSGAQTTTPSSGASADTSNHDPAHEAAESPEQAAAEASGEFHGGHDGHSNTDPAHEAAESPERAAEEAAHDATATTPTTSATK